jgi:hypothetical protein
VSEKRHGTITFRCFWPPIDGIWLISLVIGIYSTTIVPFLIELLLVDFHDLPEGISNISTMCSGTVRRVMQLDMWMNEA